MLVAENEIFADPDYLLWDGASDLHFGCRDGGFVAITPASVEEKIRFADCKFVPDFALTGIGSYVYETNTVRWSVSTPGGQLEYRADGSGRQVSGTWKGQPVDLSE